MNDDPIFSRSNLVVLAMALGVVSLGCDRDRRSDDASPTLEHQSERGAPPVVPPEAPVIEEFEDPTMREPVRGEDAEQERQLPRNVTPGAGEEPIPEEGNENERMR
jgi:hypothetical protein